MLWLSNRANSRRRSNSPRREFCGIRAAVISRSVPDDCELTVFKSVHPEKTDLATVFDGRNGSPSRHHAESLAIVTLPWSFVPPARPCSRPSRQAERGRGHLGELSLPTLLFGCIVSEPAAAEDRRRSENRAAARIFQPGSDIVYPRRSFYVPQHEFSSYGRTVDFFSDARGWVIEPVDEALLAASATCMWFCPSRAPFVAIIITNERRKFS